MPTKDVRKIIQAGNALAVVIPKAWTNFYELKKGDLVEVVTNGNLTIVPIKTKKKSKGGKDAK